MNYELHLIAKLLRDIAPQDAYNILLKKCKDASIFLVYKDAWEEVIEYKNKYGHFPDEQTFILEVGQDLPETPESLEFYLDKIKDAYLYSRMAEVNTQIVDALKSGDPIEAYKKASSELQSLEGSLYSGVQDLDLAFTVNERVTQYDKRRGRGIVSGIPCGWVKLDEETTGWQDGELTFLMGRMGTFKTWILISWACHAWSEGYNVIFFSKEMGKVQVSRRVDAYLAATRFKDIRLGLLQDKDFKKFQGRLTSLYANQKNRFIIIDTSRVSSYDIDFLRSKVWEYIPDIIFVDGAYFLEGKGKASWEQQTSVTRGLKRLCLSINKPIVASTQASKGAAGKGKRVLLHNAAYSDSYGQDGDNVIGITRLWDKVLDEETNDVLIELLKMRDGEYVKLLIHADLDAMLFSEAYSQVDTSVLEEEEEEGDLMI
jgi:replicative DNA helicase